MMPARFFPRVSTMLMLSLSIATGCRRAVKPPEPIRITSRNAPAVILQAAANELTVAGLEVIQNDAAANRLTARVAGKTGDLRQFIKCNDADEIALWRLGTTTLTVVVTTTRDGDENLVTVNARAATKAFQGGTHAINDDTSCVSNGTLERRIGRAIAAP